ncbi:MAG: hypothetical protein KJO49_00070 [Bacteroidia bacterium]|nr:hypothetical protein [Bacteroidia bacterium]MBT8267603.1 hypothetical protein [Bacteroidia bacterium]NNF81895.1 hypothetical protein [Flavobacteriaceae bacterium]NNK70465.1 hypothetical protein [Flavobacteriaceae bacterium]NNL79750.1 hypothetical protein [Flavobacteriaceae bacterium]
MEKIINSLSWIDSAATIVWIVLILIMLIIIKNLHSNFGWQDRTLKFGLILLLVVVAYPLYTRFFLQLEIGFIGNIATLIMTLIYMKRIRVKKMKEAQWLWPQIIWICLVSIYLASMLIEDHIVH